MLLNFWRLLNPPRESIAAMNSGNYPQTDALSHHFWSISSQSQKIIKHQFSHHFSPKKWFFTTRNHRLHQLLGSPERRCLGVASPAAGGSLQVARAAAGALPGLWVARSAAAEAGGPGGWKDSRSSQPNVSSIWWRHGVFNRIFPYKPSIFMHFRDHSWKPLYLVSASISSKFLTEPATNW